MFGEGPTNEIPHHVIESPYTNRDVRYVTKGESLHALILDWPGKGKVITFEHLSPGNSKIGKIRDVSMFGYTGKIKWEHYGDGLMVTMPENPPCDFAYALKIEFEN
jgi:alpha-L-fucosidase